jgi:outer membrane receptor protein involved in Fe transport
MFRKIFTTVSIILLITSAAIAQTGRVVGKAVDQQSDEPLIGANIIIVGTSLGAATDVNGNFIISQVPPGNYNIKASYIGYQDVTVQGVNVIQGLSAEVNFRLPSSTIATGEVVIVSQRPIVEKSATNAIRIVSAEDLQALPVRTINSYLSLQPGVVEQEGNIYIRGSRPDETGYMLEGADVKNIYSRNGGSVVTVTPDALQEMLVQAGGYTAEYGNANAGIVQQSFKTGSEKYHFSIRGETDNFVNGGDKFLGTYSYGYSDYVVTASGPLISNKIKVFLSGENNFTRDYAPMFFDGNPATYSNGELWDTTKLYDNGISGGNKGDSQVLKWDAGSIPGRMQNRYTVNGNILLDMKPLLVKLSGAFTDQKRRFNDPFVSYIFDLGRLPMVDLNNMLLSLKGTYFVSSNSFVEANVDYFDYRTKTYDPNFKDNVLSYDDSLAVSQYGWQYDSYTTPPQLYNFNGFPFLRPGSPIYTYVTPLARSGYNKTHWSYMGGSASYTAQYGGHEFKAGGSFQRWTLRRWTDAGFGGILNAIRLNPDIARNTAALSDLIVQNSGTSLSNYGYDVFGNETSAAPFAPKHPLFASGYIQDKVELSDLIINAGLRFDYIKMDNWTISDLSNPFYNETNWTIPDSLLGTSKAFQYVSPRLGFSFPVTDRTIFHLQYGKFVQAPSLDLAYAGITYAAHVIQGGTAFGDPVAYNLQPVRTTQYEIGFTQQFTDFAALDLTAFYKDIKGQVQYELQQTVAGSLSQPYPIYSNQDFATTKGLELSVRLRRIERLRAELNYTYSDSRGTNSGTVSGFGAQQSGFPLPTVIVPLDFDQTHRGSLMLDYRFGKDDGGPILEQLGINLLLTFNSGHPYTIDQRAGLGQNSPWTGGVLSTGYYGDSRANKPLEPVNSSITPWEYNIDLRVDKTITFLNTDFNIYLIVLNLLNTKNVNNVYLATGNAYNDGFLQTSDAQSIIKNSNYGERFADLYKSLNLTNRQNTLAGNGGLDLFSNPRQIRLGILISY